MSVIAERLGVFSSGQPERLGQGVEVTLEHTWPWPPWVTLLGLIVLIVLVVAIHLREAPRATRSLRLALAALRVTLLGLVVFMMYGWMQHRHRTDLPDLIVILDDSQSMSVEDHFAETGQRGRLMRWVADAGFDSPARFNLARSLLLNKRFGWLASLSKRYRVKVYLMGESARLQFESAETLPTRLAELQAAGTASRLGQCLQQVFETQRGRPTAAMIILTDGITTDGPALGEAAQLARRKAIPLYLVGLGNDEPPRDVRLSDLLVDEVVFADDVVNFDFKLHSHGYSGRPAVVQLRRADVETVLAERQLELPPDGVPLSVRLSYRPRDEGPLEHVIELRPLDGEVDRDNNRLTRRVQVRNAAIRVLLVQGYPNYEFRFLKNLLGRLVRRDGTEEKLVDLTSVLLDADLEYSEQDASAQRVFPVARKALNSFDVLIFGDVNPEALGRTVMTNIADFAKERGGGVVFLAGPSFTPLAYRDTPLAGLLPLDLNAASLPPPDAELEREFTVVPTPLGLETSYLQLGDSSEQTAAVWQGLPGLRWVLTAAKLPPAARVLIVQADGTEPGGTPLPVIWMQFVGAGKVIFHATDETYRWSRFQGDDSSYARYWLQTLRYLSRAKLLSDAQTVEVFTDRQEYRQGDTVRIGVRFSDERLAPASDHGVRVVIEGGRGRRRQVNLNRESTRRGEFSGILSDLAVDEYRLWLSAPNIEPRPSPRVFSVHPPFGEQARLEMDSDDLQEAAKTSRGRFYTLDNVSRLPRELPRGRQVRVESLPPEPIWNSPLFIAAFVGLITAEWLLRKRAGMI